MLAIEGAFSNRVFATTTIAFLAVLTIFGLSLSCYKQLYAIYEDYWGAPGQEPQGTIFSVQTVEFNIANSSMPFAASQAIIKGNSQYLQDMVDSSFGLIGFVVTECAVGSKESECVDESILSYTSSGYEWIDNENVFDLIAQSDFATLTSGAELGLDWRYTAPKNEDIINLEFSPSGNIIGRLYYVRQPAPSFSKQLSAFIQRPLSAEGQSIKYFPAVVLTHFSFGLLILLALYAGFRLWLRFIVTFDEKRSLKENLRLAERELEESLSDALMYEQEVKSASEKIARLEDDERKRMRDIEAREAEIQTLRSSIAFIEADRGVSDELLSGLEGELRQKEEENDRLKAAYAQIESEREMQVLQEAELRRARDAQDSDLLGKEAEIERLKVSLGRRKVGTTLAEKTLEAFVRGLNTTASHRLMIHPKVYDDVKFLEKSSISYESILDTIARISKTEISDGSLAKVFPVLSGIDGVYHSKRQHIRVYFKRSQKEIMLLGVWDQEHAPHDSGAKSWRDLKTRALTV